MSKAEKAIKFICEKCQGINFFDYTLEIGIYNGMTVMKDRINCSKCGEENFVYEEIKPMNFEFEPMPGVCGECGFHVGSCRCPPKSEKKYTVKQMVNDIAEHSRVVVCAAIKHRAGGGIICGPRHFDKIMNDQIRTNVHTEWIDAEQGFVDQFGKFLTRKEAHIIAKERNQIIKYVGGDRVELFSENLY